MLFSGSLTISPFHLRSGLFHRRPASMAYESTDRISRRFLFTVAGDIPLARRLARKLITAALSIADTQPGLHIASRRLRLALVLSMVCKLLPAIRESNISRSCCRGMWQSSAQALAKLLAYLLPSLSSIGHISPTRFRLLITSSRIDPPQPIRNTSFALSLVDPHRRWVPCNHRPPLFCFDFRSSRFRYLHTLSTDLVVRSRSFRMKRLSAPSSTPQPLAIASKVWPLSITACLNWSLKDAFDFRFISLPR